MLFNMKNTKKVMKKVVKKASPASGRRADVNNDVRSLTKVSGGSSYAITLPHAVVTAFKWKGRQKLKLDVNEKNKTITIRDWKK